MLQKQIGRGHASACDDILSQREQLPVCCTNVCSASGCGRWVCDHVSSCHICVADLSSTSIVWVRRQTHLCCRDLSGVIPYDCTHMCVTEGRSSWSQFPFAGLAYVSFFKRASTCGAVHVCLCAHTHVCCKSQEFVVMPRLAVTF